MILNNLAGLLTWKIKLGLAIALVLGCAWYVRHRETVAFEQGAAAGRKSGWADAEKAQKEIWAAEREKIQLERESIAAAGSELQTKRGELERARTSMNLELTARLNSIESKNVEDRNFVYKQNSIELVPGIRNALEQLRTIERQRDNASAPGPTVQR